MNKIISGVYQITNKIDGKFYIGCSTNIFRRWKSHIARSNEKLGKEYEKPLYVAFRKYGIENFSFEVLEETTPEDIFEKETYYIHKKKAYQLGYNKGTIGENHGKSKLTLNDVFDIRTRYAEKESKRNVYLDYKDKINKTGFHKVWNGYTWKDIKMDVYTDENKKFHKNDTGSSGEKNSRTKLSNDDVIKIREDKANGKNKKEVYNRYSDKLTYGSFSNIWCGCNWKNIT